VRPDRRRLEWLSRLTTAATLYRVQKNKRRSMTHSMKNFLGSPLSLALVLIAFPLNRLCAAAPTPLWSDEFDQAIGSPPDTSRWVYDLGATGWGNNELQTYTKATENAAVAADPQATDGKALVIRALKRPEGGYTSARLKTQGKFSTLYGRIEGRLKTTDGQGIWPAFWMLGENIETVGWPSCGEIDIIEVIGANPNKVQGTIHGPGYSGAKGPTARPQSPCRPARWIQTTICTRLTGHRIKSSGRSMGALTTRVLPKCCLPGQSGCSTMLHSFCS
jgi:hypothetical protein